MTLHICVTDDIATCRALRRTVFIEEQGVSEADEVDGLDDTAVHLLARQEGAAIGSARLLTLGEIGKIGRVCVLPAARGSGIGAALTRAAVAHFRTVPGVRVAKLGAQTHAIGFYQKLGFEVAGPEYMDAGIPHHDMILRF
ncbi:GNAT family N-acetyltransferase [Roseicitreum antarcticum]|uniref:ElaA protein n=1 Tax=Roseicitreum antarcticum TaxID=564137 RepID=A0A1H2SK75_9RHOB|nr:GNAT family N-acetyltransferase [Roseicitreum antarcticum]SDW31982.1 ElaA protein [Roseicitreum antarcticum]